MGKEVKIGLAVGGGFLLLAGVWFFGFHGPPPAPKAVENEEIEEGTGKARTASAVRSTGGLGTQPAGPIVPGSANDPLMSRGGDRPLVPGAPADGVRTLSRTGPAVTPNTLPMPLPPGGDLPTTLTVPPAGLVPVGPTLTPTPGVPGSPAAPGATARKTHVVKPGESFWSIARDTLGDATKHKLIEAANPEVRGNALRAGMTLVIPEVTVAAAPGRTAPATPGQPTGPSTIGQPVALPPAPGTVRTTPQAPVTGEPSISGDEYVVKEGDRFDWIVRARYGNLSYRSEVLAANKDLLAGNANMLKPKMVLKLPPVDKLKSAKPTTEVARPTTPTAPVAPVPGATSTGPKTAPVNNGATRGFSID
jgi:nucleoid-associated protein YgaU